MFSVKNRFLKYICLPFLFLSIVCFCLISGYLFYLSFDLPDISGLHNWKYDLPTQIYDRNEELVHEYFEQKRVFIPIDQVSKVMKQALIAIEDNRFYSHIGIDPKRIIKAIYVDVLCWCKKQGASTITQQTAKNFFTGNERSFRRKAKELLISLKMEKLLEKDKILQLYLNYQYFGGRRVYGIESAAQAYFSKSASELFLSEAALLAGLVQAPSKLSPIRYIEKATNRRNTVLSAMARIGFITHSEKEIAQSQAIELNLSSNENLNEVSYYVEEVRKRLLERFDQDTLNRGGFKVYTAMDVQYQLKAQKALEDGLIAIDKRHGYRGPIENLQELYDQYESLKNIQDSTGDQLAEDSDLSILDDPSEATSDEFKVSDMDTSESDLIRPPNPLEIVLSKYLDKNRFILGEKVNALVIEVTKTEVLVDLGSEKGRIFLDSVTWARPHDLETKLKYSNKIRDLNNVFKRYDVIRVLLSDYDQDQEEFLVTLYQEPQNNGGIYALDPRTGHVLALSGGYNFKKSEFNRATQSERQPGSAFKPFVYATALKEAYTPANIIEDTPEVYKQLGKIAYIPKNYDGKFLGKISIRNSLSKSRNVSTVKLARDLGIKNVIQTARDLGITTHIPKDVTIALGSASVTLEELVAAYGVFANGGNLMKPVYITRIEDRDNNVLERTAVEGNPVLSPETSYLITSILKDVVRRDRRTKDLQHPASGKTGTTNKSTDAWFIGYIPQLITGVYVGNDDQKIPIGKNEYGSTAALPIWVDFMKFATESLSILPVTEPKEIVRVKINKNSGSLACKRGKNQMFEFFIQGSEPTQCHEDPENLDETKNFANQSDDKFIKETVF